MMQQSFMNFSFLPISFPHLINTFEQPQLFSNNGNKLPDCFKSKFKLSAKEKASAAAVAWMPTNNWLTNLAAVPVPPSPIRTTCSPCQKNKKLNFSLNRYGTSTRRVGSLFRDSYW